MRFEVLWSAPRHPTAHVWHDVSTVWRSHGRARNRYALAVSAPTGQIWTVLPEKYDENFSSGYVITSVSAPRPPKSISGSPATSAAKRVHRPHWMQRSRSSSTRSLIAIGFSK